MLRPAPAGPAFWGLINPEWSLCNKGHRQSPVDLEPDRLLFDPNLRNIRVNAHRVGDLSNPELRLLTDQLERVQYRGDSVPVTRISIHGLLPNTSAYMTYDGSTTMPGCHETVTWIVFNKPIYITKQQLLALRRLMQGTIATPKAPLGNNFRGPQSLHNRPLRTNIDFRKDAATGNQCVSMKKTTYYKANVW
ncbi:hypothetical protein FOCC_FOCC008002 [Frankliniella occidentalis]|nr:hypothetical protein FOCC_FOCC008002 [Frankliniella occidentalis]